MLGSAPAFEEVAGGGVEDAISSVVPGSLLFKGPLRVRRRNRLQTEGRAALGRASGSCGPGHRSLGDRRETKGSELAGSRCAVGGRGWGGAR